MNDYAFYVADTETTGLDFVAHDIVELSLYRLSDDSQKTWWLRPINLETIDPGALRVNGHKLEDLLWKTIDGRNKYLEADKQIIDIENWISEDRAPKENRCLIGHNIARFDHPMMEHLWIKCNSKDSFPFGRRMIDTMVLELAMDYAKGQFAEGYSLSNLNKNYGIRNEKAHSAEADTKATKEVFLKQIEFLRKLMGK